MQAGDFFLFAAFAYGLGFAIQYRALPRLLALLGVDPHGGGEGKGGEENAPWWARWLLGLASCPFCSGFWAGLAWTAEPWLPRPLVFALAGAGLCFALDRWTE